MYVDYRTTIISFSSDEESGWSAQTSMLPYLVIFQSISLAMTGWYWHRTHLIINWCGRMDNRLWCFYISGDAPLPLRNEGALKEYKKIFSIDELLPLLFCRAVAAMPTVFFLISRQWWRIIRPPAQTRDVPNLYLCGKTNIMSKWWKKSTEEQNQKIVAR